MTSAAKSKGDRAERECQELLRELLRVPDIRRELGAGRADDRGDIHGVPGTVIQVTWRNDLAAALREKLPAVEQQRCNAHVPFAAVFLRRSRSPEPWVVAMTPTQFARLWKYAILGWKTARKQRRVEPLKRQ